MGNLNNLPVKWKENSFEFSNGRSDTKNAYAYLGIYTIICILFVIWIIYSIFFFSRVQGYLITKLVRLFTKYEIDITSLSVSMLSGKIMFKKITYTSNDFSIKIFDGYIVYRWWIPLNENLNLVNTLTSNRIHFVFNHLDLHIYNRSQLYHNFSHNISDFGSICDKNTMAWRKFWLTFFPVLKFQISQMRIMFGNAKLPNNILFEIYYTKFYYIVTPAKSVNDPFCHKIKGKAVKIICKLIKNDTQNTLGRPPIEMASDNSILLFSAGILNYELYQDCPGLRCENDKTLNKITDYPEWGVDIIISKDFYMHYGIWFDQNRKLLQNFFFPSYEDAPPNTDKNGTETNGLQNPNNMVLRKHLSFNGKVTFSDPDNYIDIIYKIKQQATQKLCVKFGKNSNLKFSIPFSPLIKGGRAEDPDFEFVNCVMNDLAITTSQPFDQLFRSQNLAIIIYTNYQTHFNSLQIYNFNITFEHATLYGLYDTKNLLNDFIDNWTMDHNTTPHHLDVLTFYPCIWNFDLKHCKSFNIYTFTNQYNYMEIGKFCESGNHILNIQCESFNATYTLDMSTFAPKTSFIPFNARLNNIRLLMHIPEYNISKQYLKCLYEQYSKYDPNFIIINEPYIQTCRREIRDSEEKLWFCVWHVKSHIDLSLRYKYYNIYDHPKLETNNVIAFDKLWVNLQLPSSNVYVNGAFLQCLLNFKENYFGDYQQHTPCVNFSVNNNSEGKKLIFHHMDMEIMVTIHNTNIYLLQDVHFNITPVFSMDMLSFKMKRLIEESLFLVSVNECHLQFIDRFCEPFLLETTEFTYQGMTFRAKSYLSRRDIPITQESLEYAWLVDINSKPICAKLNVIQLKCILDAFKQIQFTFEMTNTAHGHQNTDSFNNILSFLREEANTSTNVEIIKQKFAKIKNLKQIKDNNDNKNDNSHLKLNVWSISLEGESTITIEINNLSSDMNPIYSELKFSSIQLMASTFYHYNHGHANFKVVFGDSKQPNTNALILALYSNVGLNDCKSSNEYIECGYLPIPYFYVDGYSLPNQNNRQTLLHKDQQTYLSFHDGLTHRLKPLLVNASLMKYVDQIVDIVNKTAFHEFETAMHMNEIFKPSNIDFTNSQQANENIILRDAKTLETCIEETYTPVSTNNSKFSSAKSSFASLTNNQELQDSTITSQPPCFSNERDNSTPLLNNKKCFSSQKVDLSGQNQIFLYENVLFWPKYSINSDKYPISQFATLNSCPYWAKIIYPKYYNEKESAHKLLDVNCQNPCLHLGIRMEKDIHIRILPLTLDIITLIYQQLNSNDNNNTKNKILSHRETNDFLNSIREFHWNLYKEVVSIYICNDDEPLKLHCSGSISGVYIHMMQNCLILERVSLPLLDIAPQIATTFTIFIINLCKLCWKTRQYEVKDIKYSDINMDIDSVNCQLRRLAEPNQQPKCAFISDNNSKVPYIFKDSLDTNNEYQSFDMMEFGLKQVNAHFLLLSVLTNDDHSIFRINMPNETKHSGLESNDISPNMKIDITLQNIWFNIPAKFYVDTDVKDRQNNPNDSFDQDEWHLFSTVLSTIVAWQYPFNRFMDALTTHKNNLTFKQQRILYTSLLHFISIADSLTFQQTHLPFTYSELAINIAMNPSFTLLRSLYKNYLLIKESYSKVDLNPCNMENITLLIMIYFTKSLEWQNTINALNDCYLIQIYEYLTKLYHITTIESSTNDCMELKSNNLVSLESSTAISIKQPNPLLVSTYEFVPNRSLRALLYSWISLPWMRPRYQSMYRTQILKPLHVESKSFYQEKNYVQNESIDIGELHLNNELIPLLPGYYKDWLILRELKIDKLSGIFESFLTAKFTINEFANDFTLISVLFEKMFKCLHSPLTVLENKTREYDLNVKMSITIIQLYLIEDIDYTNLLNKKSSSHNINFKKRDHVPNLQQPSHTLLNSINTLNESDSRLFIFRNIMLEGKYGTTVLFSPCIESSFTNKAIKQIILPYILTPKRKSYIHTTRTQFFVKIETFSHHVNTSALKLIYQVLWVMKSYHVIKQEIKNRFFGNEMDFGDIFSIDSNQAAERDFTSHSSANIEQTINEHSSPSKLNEHTIDHISHPSLHSTISETSLISNSSLLSIPREFKTIDSHLYEPQIRMIEDIYNRLNDLLSHPINPIEKSCQNFAINKINFNVPMINMAIIQNLNKKNVNTTNDAININWECESFDLQIITHIAYIRLWFALEGLNLQIELLNPIFSLQMPKLAYSKIENEKRINTRSMVINLPQMSITMIECFSHTSHILLNFTAQSVSAINNTFLLINQKIKNGVLVEIGFIKLEMPEHPIVLHEIFTRISNKFTQTLRDFPTNLSSSKFSNQPKSMRHTIYTNSGMNMDDAFYCINIRWKQIDFEAALLPSLKILYTIRNIYLTCNKTNKVLASLYFADHCLTWKSLIQDPLLKFSPETRIKLPLVKLTVLYEWDIYNVKFGKYITKSKLGYLRACIRANMEIDYFERTLTTDLLNNLVFIQKVFMKEVNELLQRLTGIDQPQMPTFNPQEEENVEAPILSTNPLSQYYDLNLKFKGLQLTAATPTNIAIRFETSAIEFNISNIYFDDAEMPTSKCCDVKRTLANLKFRLSASLGQISRNLLYEEAEFEYTMLAHFTCYIMIKNSIKNQFYSSKFSHIQDGTIVFVDVQRPHLNVQALAIDKAILIYINYKTAYEYWNEQRATLKRDVQEATEQVMNKLTFPLPQQPPKVLTQIILELNIENLGISLPLQKPPDIYNRNISAMYHTRPDENLSVGGEKSHSNPGSISSSIIIDKPCATIESHKTDMNSGVGNALGTQAISMLDEDPINLVLTIEMSRIYAYTKDVFICHGHFSNLITRFTTDFDPSWDDWTPNLYLANTPDDFSVEKTSLYSTNTFRASDKKLSFSNNTTPNIMLYDKMFQNLLTNFCYVRHGTYEVCSNTSALKAEIKWILHVNWNMNGVDFFSNTYIGICLKSLIYTLTILTNEEITNDDRSFEGSLISWDDDSISLKKPTLVTKDIKSARKKTAQLKLRKFKHQSLKKHDNQLSNTSDMQSNLQSNPDNAINDPLKIIPSKIIDEYLERAKTLHILKKLGASESLIKKETTKLLNIESQVAMDYRQDIFRRINKQSLRALLKQSFDQDDSATLQPYLATKGHQRQNSLAITKEELCCRKRRYRKQHIKSRSYGGKYYVCRDAAENHVKDKQLHKTQITRNAHGSFSQPLNLYKFSLVDENSNLPDNVKMEPNLASEMEKNAKRKTSNNESKINFDLDVNVNIDSGTFILFNQNKDMDLLKELMGREKNIMTKPASDSSLATIISVKNHHKVKRNKRIGYGEGSKQNQYFLSAILDKIKTFINTNMLKYSSIIVLPGLNVKVQYSSHHIFNNDSTNPNPTSDNCVKIGNESFKTADLYVWLTIKTFIKENCLHPHLLDFIEMVLEPLPILPPTGDKKHQKTPEEKKSHEEMNTNSNVVYVATTNFPVNVLVYLRVNPSSFRFSCLPLSRVECMVYLPSLDLILTSSSSETNHPFEPLKIQGKTDIAKLYTQYQFSGNGINVFINLSRFNLEIYHPFGGGLHHNTSLSNLTGIGPIEKRHSGEKMPMRKKFLSLELDYILVNVCRKRYVEEIKPCHTKDFDVKDKRKTRFNKMNNQKYIIYVSGLCNFGFASFRYDMRRLGEILVFPKAWYRKSIAKRLLLGEHAGQYKDYSDPNSLPTERIKKSKQQNDPITNDQRPTLNSNKGPIIWESLLIFGVQIEKVGIHMNMGNVMGNIQWDSKNWGFSSRCYLNSNQARDIKFLFRLGNSTFDAKSGIVGGDLEVVNFYQDGHIYCYEPQTHLTNRVMNALLHALQLRMDYMGNTVIITRVSQLKSHVTDDIESQALANQSCIFSTIRFHTTLKWDHFQLLICQSTQNDLIKMVSKIREFFQQQFQSGLSMLPHIYVSKASISKTNTVPLTNDISINSIPININRRNAIGNLLGNDISDITMSPLFASQYGYWLKIRKLFQKRVNSSSSDKKVPLMLGGSYAFQGNHLSLACFYGINFRSKTWAIFSMRQINAVFTSVNSGPNFQTTCLLANKNAVNKSSASQNNANSLTINTEIIAMLPELDIDQNFVFQLGREDSEPNKYVCSEMAVIMKITRGNYVPPKSSSIQEWCNYAFFKSSIDDVDNFLPTTGIKTIGAKEFRNMSSDTIFSLPKLQLSLRTEHLIDITSLTDENKSITNFQVHYDFLSDFDSHILVSVDAELLAFLHDLIISYSSKNFGQKLTSSPVSYATENIKQVHDDFRSFTCCTWKLEPTLRIISWKGQQLEAYGVDFILQKLGFNHARLTIPKWIQRGAMDHLDKFLAFVIYKLLVRTDKFTQNK